jgi:glutamate/tyrosine decarboxylase-like PLP-dependent enzyme
MTGGDLPWFSDYGFQLSRGFRALKAWMSIKEHGIHKYGRLIQQNIEQAAYLAELIEKTPELELMAPVLLNVVCFRYRRDGMDDSMLDELNRKILVELQEQGIAAPSGTNIRGRYVIHVANTNHRSSRKDFNLLVKEMVRIGQELT